MAKRLSRRPVSYTHLDVYKRQTKLVGLAAVTNIIPYITSLTGLLVIMYLSLIHI